MNNKLSLWFYIPLWFGLILWAPFLSGQSLEISWQPIPKSELGAAVVVSDGFVWAASSPAGGTGHLTIQKVNWNGQPMWDFSTYIQAFNLVGIHELFRTPENGILATFTSFECDCCDLTGFILLDSLGQLVNQTILKNWEGRMLKKFTTLSDTQITPLWAWQRDGMANIYWSSLQTLVRLDSINGNLVKSTIQVDIKDGMALCRDPWGAIHISAPGGGIGIYDHVLDSITTIQFSDFGAVLDILFPTDSTMILLGYEHLAIVKNNGTILQEEVFPDQQLLSGFLSNGNLVMNILEISQNKHRFVLMNPDLSLINSIQAFSDDTRIQTVLKGKNAHLVFGQESQNVFMKSIDFAGQVEPLRQDAAITNMTWTDITTSVVKQVYCRPEVAFSGLEIEIQNNGLDTLNSVLVNWNEQVQFSYNTSWCQSFSRQFPLEKLKLPPGATIWVPLPEITFFKDIPCDSSYQFDICFELSTPNNRIDANHSNDKFCVPIDVKTTSTADLKSDRHVLVYPDPFSYTLHLDNLPNTTKNVQLLDLFGRVISAQPVSAGTSFSFDLPNGPSGLYLLVISDEDGQIIETKRLLRVD